MGPHYVTLMTRSEGKAPSRYVPPRCLFQARSARWGRPRSCVFWTAGGTHAWSRVSAADSADEHTLSERAIRMPIPYRWESHESGRRVRIADLGGEHERAERVRADLDAGLAEVSVLHEGSPDVSMMPVDTSVDVR
jgi:hypothetical protein